MAERAKRWSGVISVRIQQLAGNALGADASKLSLSNKEVPGITKELEIKDVG